ncbi:glycerophosphodiester phosphodiesterase family protein [Pacificoceanicola onchidii]|uniref:glycerophosphodiester phosphodiesterase family protein n=1 Tax=Pacificoceanicola onchidii TaxID=2562685 RepID=UPI0010A5BC06|nr:glycerophosphodiester phosphodiesterase family protein [Pacificoceanicola onchidii]
MAVLKRMMQLGLVLAALGWLNNTSLLFAPEQGPGIRLLAHRGVHQTYPREGLTAETCTATRIYMGNHEFIENTIPSMQAAFAAGADVVELDVHLTPGGEFAVFHDWRLECRTDGSGVTRAQPLTYLKTLDIGFGYTADGGETYPLRGSGVGLMPTLTEVFEARLGGQYLINFKSSNAEEGAALAKMLSRRDWRNQVWGVYGGTIPTRAAQDAVSNLPGFDKPRVTECIKLYVLLGWSGYVPEACADGMVVVPMDVGPYLWGWPHRFTRRMRLAGSEVILLGPLDKTGYSAGVDTQELWDQVPEGFDGYVWTNRVEVFGDGVPKAELVGRR